MRTNKNITHKCRNLDTIANAYHNDAGHNRESLKKQWFSEVKKIAAEIRREKTYRDF